MLKSNKSSHASLLPFSFRSLTVFELSLLLGPESPPLLLPPVPQEAVLAVGGFVGLGLGDIGVRSVVDLVRVGLELAEALVDLKVEDGGDISVGAFQLRSRLKMQRPADDDEFLQFHCRSGFFFARYIREQNYNTIQLQVLPTCMFRDIHVIIWNEVFMFVPVKSALCPQWVPWGEQLTTAASTINWRSLLPRHCVVISGFGPPPNDTILALKKWGLKWTLSLSLYANFFQLGGCSRR